VDPALSDLEELLRRSRPVPRPEFVRDLEASLMRSVQRRALHVPRLRGLRVQRLRLAVGSAVAFAALILVLSFAGLRPLGTHGTNGAKADRQCVTVDEWVLERDPRLVVGAHRRLWLQLHTELVARPRIHCR
jgi:hypothetical protein